MTESPNEFVMGGGTAVAFKWLTDLASPDATPQQIWDPLDYPMQLSFVQAWLMGPGSGEIGSDRDAAAREFVTMAHAESGRFFRGVLDGWRDVYADIDGRPALIGFTEPVGVDLEIVGFTSDEYAGVYEQPVTVPAHTFIMRRMADGQWRIAANSRRLPVPGWPPTEQLIPGLTIDGC